MFVLIWRAAFVHPPASSYLHKFLLKCGLFLSLIAGSAADDGKLTIYPHASPIGTVAKRDFVDENGELTQTIYYRSRIHKEPADEADLLVQSIRLRSYSDGRLVWEGTYDPGYFLNTAGEVYYSESGKVIGRVSRNAYGQLLGEQRLWDNPDGRPAQLRIFYDDAGENVLTFSGNFPNALDMGYRWGKPVDGLACGLAVNRKRGKLEEIELNLTLRNFSDQEKHPLTSLWFYEYQVEMRNAAGALVPQDLEKIESRKEKLVQMNNGINESKQTLYPHNAKNYSGGVSLSQWFTNAPAGKYSVLVKRRGEGAEFDLVSNSVEIEIEP